MNNNNFFLFWKFWFFLISQTLAKVLILQQEKKVGAENPDEREWKKKTLFGIEKKQQFRDELSQQLFRHFVVVMT